jgi:hypothetical protein
MLHPCREITSTFADDASPTDAAADLGEPALALEAGEFSLAAGGPHEIDENGFREFSFGRTRFRVGDRVTPELAVLLLRFGRMTTHSTLNDADPVLPTFFPRVPSAAEGACEGIEYPVTGRGR